MTQTDRVFVWTKNYHQRGELTMTQGVLPFKYEKEKTQSSMTALAGLPNLSWPGPGNRIIQVDPKAYSNYSPPSNSTPLILPAKANWMATSGFIPWFAIVCRELDNIGIFIFNL